MPVDDYRNSRNGLLFQIGQRRLGKAACFLNPFFVEWFRGGLQKDWGLV